MGKPKRKKVRSVAIGRYGLWFVLTHARDEIMVLTQDQQHKALCKRPDEVVTKYDLTIWAAGFKAGKDPIGEWTTDG